MVISKLKLFFLAFLWVCLWLTSFSSADVYTWYFIDWSFDYKATFSSANSYSYIYSVENPFNVFDSSVNNRVKFCAYFSWRDWLIWLNINYSVLSKSSKSFSSLSSYSTNFPWQAVNNSCYTFYLNYSNNYTFIRWSYIGILLFPNSSRTFPYTFEDTLNLSWYYTFESDLISLSSSSVDCSQDSNYLQCLEDKNQLIWQVSTLSWNLSSCQSDLSDCMWWQDASLLACIDQKEQCESSLDTLSWNYASLENMNSSLSSQLQECLESWGWSWSSALICNTFDLFWDSDNTRYSFPINNNLILPPWYKGFVNEWVLAIKQDNNNAYSIDDEDFQKVMDSYWVVFLYLFGWALFLMFLFVIRKYFIWLKS